MRRQQPVQVTPAARAWPSHKKQEQEEEAKKTQATPAPVDISQLLTYKDLMHILRLSKHKVYQIIHRGEFPIVRIDEEIRVRPEALAKWIAEHEEVW